VSNHRLKSGGEKHKRDTERNNSGEIFFHIIVILSLLAARERW
jgi:hypothetical protein